MQFPEHGTQGKKCHLKHQPLKAYWWSLGNGETDPKSSSQIFHDNVITPIFFSIPSFPTNRPFEKRTPSSERSLQSPPWPAGHTTTSTKCESFWGLLNQVRLFSSYKILYPNGGHNLALHYTGAPLAFTKGLRGLH